MYQDDFSTGITDSAELCCQSVADTPGAITWAWVQEPQDSRFVRGTCYGLSLNLKFDAARPDLLDQCVAENPGVKVKIAPGSNERGGLLQCGSNQWS